ncbi:MAG: hypothetical protein ACI4W2_01565 [Eubacterium sp.]
MKNIIIIIGTIMLGVIIVNTMILGDSEDSLKGAAGEVVGRGTQMMQTIGGGE